MASFHSNQPPSFHTNGGYQQPESFHKPLALAIPPTQEENIEVDDQFIDLETWALQQRRFFWVTIFGAVLMIISGLILLVISIRASERSHEQNLAFWDLQLREENIKSDQNWKMANSVKSSGHSNSVSVTLSASQEASWNKRMDDIEAALKKLEAKSKSGAAGSVKDIFTYTDAGLNGVSFDLGPGPFNFNPSSVLSIPQHATVVVLKFLILAKGKHVAAPYENMKVSWSAAEKSYSLNVPVVLNQNVDLGVVAYDSDTVYALYSSGTTFTIEGTNFQQPNDSKMYVFVIGYM